MNTVFPLFFYHILYQGKKEREYGIKACYIQFLKCMSVIKVIKFLKDFIKEF